MEEVKIAPKKPRFSRTWKALTLVIALLILYTVYHVCYGLVESIKTTPAGLVEQSSSIILEGVIFREEEGIITSNKGRTLGCDLFYIPCTSQTKNKTGPVIS